jgi:hypothetical protein
MGLPVPFVTPVRPAAQGDQGGTMLAERRRPATIEVDAEEVAPAAGRRRPARHMEPGQAWSGRGDDRQALAGSLGFMAQQIFQEMQSGLYLEPWAQGTGAYRRAGAEPPLGSSSPAVISLTV